MKIISQKNFFLAPAILIPLLVSGMLAFAQFTEKGDYTDAGYMDNSFADHDWFYDYSDRDSWDTDYYKGELGYNYDQKDFNSSLYGSRFL